MSANISVGDVFPTTYWGDVEIVSFIKTSSGKGRRAVVKFINTGNMAERKMSEIRKGNVRDDIAYRNGIKLIGYEHPCQTAARLAPGTTYKSTMWGDVEVVEYRGNKDIDIVFLESGNVINVQKHALESGLVRDIVRQKLETSIKNNLIEDEAERSRKEVARLREQGRIQRVDENKKRVEAYQQRLISEAKAREDKRLSDLSSTTYNSSYGGEYKISRLLSSVDCEVTFCASGNIEAVTVQKAKKGSVVDTRVFSPEQVEVVKKEKSAAYYLNDREVRLQKAKDYQKANPDRCRTYNRNRRARRVGAEGSHTQQEVDSLFVAQEGRCTCCGVDLDDTKHLDHIMPLILGGSNSIENLQWLCQFCNNSKSGKHPSIWAQQILTQEFKDRRLAAMDYSSLPSVVML